MNVVRKKLLLTIKFSCLSTACVHVDGWMQNMQLTEEEEKRKKWKKKIIFILLKRNEKINDMRWVVIELFVMRSGPMVVKALI